MELSANHMKTAYSIHVSICHLTSGIDCRLGRGMSSRLIKTYDADGEHAVNPVKLSSTMRAHNLIRQVDGLEGIRRAFG